MKNSKRLLVGTVGALYALMALYVGANRLWALDDAREPFAPQRTSAAELAALRDFDEIEIESDFSVEVVQQAEYSIEAFGMAADNGDLLARVENGVLLVRGYGNPDGARLRITMPELVKFDTGFSQEVSISGFSGEALEIQVSTGQTVELLDNDIEALQIRTFDVPEVRLDRASFANGLRYSGRARLSIID
jgi:hypothetical protein